VFCAVVSETSDSQDTSPPAGDESPSVADGVPKQLDLRYVRAQTISRWISTAVISGLSLAILLFTWAMGWLVGWALVAVGMLWPLVPLGLIWLTLRHPRWVYDTTSYVVRPDGIEIHCGIFWKSITSVPRSRVQHTDVSQGPIFRRFGLARLTMYTAGNHYSALTLSGLTHETATRIRDFLLRRDECHAP
jgi:membrane protein YdbS with pleckstrin-like domain